MITYEEAYRAIGDEIIWLYVSDVLFVDDRPVIDKELQLIGADSPLDSIAFIAFLTGLEERLGITLVISSVHDFNVADTAHKFDPFHPTLHVDTLARYITTL